MKATGIVRKVDALGRVVLPVELRRTLELEIGDSLEILVEGEAIVLRKQQACCVFCGSARRVGEFSGKPLCEQCRKRLREE